MLSLSMVKNIKYTCLQAVKAFYLILHLNLLFKDTITEKFGGRIRRWMCLKTIIVFENDANNRHFSV